MYEFEHVRIEHFGATHIFHQVEHVFHQDEHAIRMNDQNWSFSESFF